MVCRLQYCSLFFSSVAAPILNSKWLSHAASRPLFTSYSLSGLTVIQNLDKNVYDAAVIGDAAQLAGLLAKSAPTTYKNVFIGSPLHAAASSGHLECVRLLLGANADREARNNVRIALASEPACPPAVRAPFF